jgi:CO/xanthine dehydrogenase Mo-binding subunit
VTTDALSPTLAANPRLGNWLRIRSSGVVEIRSGKVELGQGVLTALAQVAAEELDVDVARIEMIPATTDLSPDEWLTAGSLSIQARSGNSGRHCPTSTNCPPSSPRRRRIPR